MIVNHEKHPVRPQYLRSYGSPQVGPVNRPGPTLMSARVCLVRPFLRVLNSVRLDLIIKSHIGSPKAGRHCCTNDAHRSANEPHESAPASRTRERQRNRCQVQRTAMPLGVWAPDRMETGYSNHEPCQYP